MGYAPKPAVDKVLARNSLTTADLGWVELNEAFAAQAVPLVRDLDLDPAVVNPLGGAIAWGHPIGATGAIISGRTVLNLRRSGKELGLATMCIGGGQAVASLWRAL
ncbi:acetyl-CoA acetyltransferase [Brachybacterium aquaticum]